MCNLLIPNDTYPAIEMRQCQFRVVRGSQVHLDKDMDGNMFTILLLQVNETTRIKDNNNDTAKCIGS